jgi:hypothetical protein
MLFNLLLVLAFSVGSYAQGSTAKKEKGAEITSLINQKRFEFKAQSATPMSGRFRQLTTSDFGVVVKNDSLESYLPYFGRAYSAPINITQSPLDFTSTKFSQTIEETKKGRWIITIKPTDTQDIRELIFDISPSGNAFLTVSSNNRQPISFHGFITPVGQR